MLLAFAVFSMRRVGGTGLGGVWVCVSNVFVAFIPKLVSGEGGEWRVHFIHTRKREELRVYAHAGGGRNAVVTEGRAVEERRGVSVCLSVFVFAYYFFRLVFARRKREDEKSSFSWGWWGERAGVCMCEPFLSRRGAGCCL